MSNCIRPITMEFTFFFLLHINIQTDKYTECIRTNTSPNIKTIYYLQLTFGLFYSTDIFIFLTKKKIRNFVSQLYVKWKFTKVLENPSLHSPFLNYDAAKIIKQVPLRWSKNQNFASKREIRGAWKVEKNKIK